MKITIFGTGYVGLVTGVCLAELGHHVYCMDIDSYKIELLQAGRCPFYEEGLEKLLHHNIHTGYLQFTTEPAIAVEHGDIQMIAVGTPPLADGTADLKYVENVARLIGQRMQNYKLIVNKSTVPMGTVDQVKNIIGTELKIRQQSIAYDVASNPEFLREGRAMHDFMHPDRIIIGVESDTALKLMRQLYAPLIEANYNFVAMSIRSAELTKYAANAFLATKISFINEMSQLAEAFGADIHEVKAGLGLDPRINPQFLNPGCGFGGSCFPKDVSALKAMAEQVGHKSDILDAVLTINQHQQALLFYKIKDYFQGDLSNKTIALWGLAFKPNTDDIRAASSRVLMELFWSAGVKIQAYDPLAMDNIAKAYGDHPLLLLCETAELALQNADVLMIVTEWNEFLQVDFAKLKQLLREPVIFDGRNIFEPRQMAQMGIEYYCIGRGGLIPKKEGLVL